jgi:dephospho-CoA kinase
VVHALYNDPDVQGALVRRFGDDITKEGQVDRQALARLVFDDVAALDWLEQLTHPRVRQIVEDWAARQSDQPEPPAMLVVEVPLLFESGAGLETYDFILTVTAPQDLRRRRLSAKLTADQFDQRARRQLSDAEKAERSDFVFENDGSRQRMKAFVAETYAAILAAAAADAEGAPVR